MAKTLKTVGLDLLSRCSSASRHTHRKFSPAFLDGINSLEYHQVLHHIYRFTLFFLCPWVALFYAVSVCSVKHHCQSFPGRSLGLDFQILISSAAFAHCLSKTHTNAHAQTPLYLDGEMTHTSILHTGVCVLPPCSTGIVCAHSCFLLLSALALPTSFSDFLLLHPSLPVFLHFLFVTIQPTYFAYISSAVPLRPRQTLSYDAWRWRSAVTAVNWKRLVRREVGNKCWYVNGD